MARLGIFLSRLISTPEERRFRKVLLCPLTLLSFLYGWAVSIRVFLYRRRIFRTRTLPCKVISVGNLTLGGTGKTPFVALVAEMVKSWGYRTAILSRGYGGKFPGPVGVVSDGERIFMGAEEAGDEPRLLAEQLQGIPVIVGKERWASGVWAVDRFQTEVIILDDGFQHVSLKRDLDLLLIDASCPFGSGRLLPRGILREPLREIRRADALILTKADEGDNIQKLKNNFFALKEKIPVFQVEYRATGIRVPGKGKSLPLENVRGKRILAFCGIARPGSFRKTLDSLKAEVVGFKIFPDHYPYRGEDVEKLAADSLRLGAEAMVTTEKDLVRLKNFPSGSVPLWAVSVAHIFRGSDRSGFESFLSARSGLRE